jgi:hypothetical protein
MENAIQQQLISNERKVALQYPGRVLTKYTYSGTFPSGNSAAIIRQTSHGGYGNGAIIVYDNLNHVLSVQRIIPTTGDGSSMDNGIHTGDVEMYTTLRVGSNFTGSGRVGSATAGVINPVMHGVISPSAISSSQAIVSGVTTSTLLNHDVMVVDETASVNASSMMHGAQSPSAYGVYDGVLDISSGTTVWLDTDFHPTTRGTVSVNMSPMNFSGNPGSGMSLKFEFFANDTLVYLNTIIQANNESVSYNETDVSFSFDLAEMQAGKAWDFHFEAPTAANRMKLTLISLGGPNIGMTGGISASIHATSLIATGPPPLAIAVTGVDDTANVTYVMERYVLKSVQGGAMSASAIEGRFSINAITEKFATKLAFTV